MEQCLVRKDIKKCQSIYSHPNYYLFESDVLHSCAKQGGPLFTYSSVKAAIHAIAVLPDDKLLVDDGKSYYRILDLATGNILVSRKMPRDVFDTERYAVSGDGRTAYRVWLKGKKYYLVVIDLSDLSYYTWPYKASLNHVADLIWTSENELLALEVAVTNDGVCHNQVTSVVIEDEGCRTTPVYRWNGSHIGKYLDGRYVWESGYNIRDLHTGGYFHLLENSDIQLPEKHVALSHTYYPEYNYLQLIDREQNIFIDCSQRKIIARYYRATFKDKALSIGHKGLCVGDEFWIGKPDGIYAMPFPIIENI